MGDDDEGRCHPLYGAQALREVLRVQGGETLIEDDGVRTLKEGASDVDTAALPMGEPPPGFTDGLEDSTRHPLEERPQTELDADRFGSGEGLRSGGPFMSQEQVKGQGAGENVILVKLRSYRDPLPPGLGSPAIGIDSMEQKKTLLGRPETAKQCDHNSGVRAGISHRATSRAVGVRDP